MVEKVIRLDFLIVSNIESYFNSIRIFTLINLVKICESMNLTSPKSLLQVVFSTFIFVSCHKRGVSEFGNCKSSIKDSSFRIEESVGLSGSERNFSVDTVVTSRNLTYFRANDTTADEYVWRFDGDPRTFTGREVALRLDQPIGKLNVTLIQSRDASNPCYNSLPHQVKYTKNLVIVNPNQNPVIGTYLGYTTSERNRQFLVSVLSNGLKNIPFPNTESYSFPNEIIYGSSSFYIAGAGTYDPSNGAYATSGFGFLSNNNQKLEIDFTYKKPSGVSGTVVLKDTFYGIKQ